MGEIDEMVRVKHDREAALLALPNVIGVAIGRREVGGEETDERVIAVLVEKKVPRSELSDESMVPTELDGIPTDVVETGPITLTQEDWSRHRPINPGSGIGIVAADGSATWGSLGLYALDSRNYLYGISNNHVLCSPLNATGSTAIQPSVKGGGTAARDRIGWIDKAVPLQGGGASNWADMGSVAIDDPKLTTSTHPVIDGPLRGHYSGVGENWQLWKVGARTGYTQGRVQRTHATVTVDYPGFGPVVMVDQIQIRGDAPDATLVGDSGSLWVTMDYYGAGLQFASTRDHSYAAHIQTVLGTWDLRVWTGSARGGEFVQGELVDSDDIVARPDPRAIEELRERTVRSPEPSSTA